MYHIMQYNMISEAKGINFFNYNTVIIHWP